MDSNRREDPEQLGSILTRVLADCERRMKEKGMGRPEGPNEFEASDPDTRNPVPDRTPSASEGTRGKDCAPTRMQIARMGGLPRLTLCLVAWGVASAQSRRMGMNDNHLPCTASSVRTNVPESSQMRLISSADA